MPHDAPNPRLTASGAFTRNIDNMTVAKLLLEYLKLEGVDKVFGVPGGALIYLIDELEQQRDAIDFIVCRQETGAAYMADGYARVTDGLGVVITTAGPSATNALTGAMNAQASNSSLLAITGEVPQVYYGKGYLQEGVDARLDVNTIFSNAVQYSAIISSPTNFQTLFEQALREARSLPGTATHISLPNDVAGSCVVAAQEGGEIPAKIPFPNSPSNYRTVPGGTDPQRSREALENLCSARRPLIFLGNGARRALRCPERLDRFTQLVEKFAIPVMTTPDGKGIFPETHALSLRNYGMTACRWPQLYVCPEGEDEHYDALMVLGSTLGELSTTVVATDHYSKMLIPRDHFVQVDLDQSVIGRDFPITMGIVAEIGATIDVMCEYGEQLEPNGPAIGERLAFIRSIKDQNSPFHDPEWRESEAAPTNPAAMVRVMNEELTSGHVLIDAGNCVGWSLNNMVVDPPVHYHSALAMGPMGFAVGAVVGAKMGDPGQTCIALVGDGAFMMQGSEVSTAAQNNVGAIFVVIYDNDLGMVSQGMAVLFPPAKQWQDYYKLGSPDLVKYSEGLGADAVAITPDQGPEAFRAALRTAIERTSGPPGPGMKPQVIVVHVDTCPMPPYGWPHVKPAQCAKNLVKQPQKPQGSAGGRPHHGKGKR